MKILIFLKLKISIFIMLAIVSNVAKAQDQKVIWQWMEQIGSPGWDISNGIISDNKNNIYLGGGFTGKLSCNKKDVESQGNKDIFIARFDLDGKIEWLWRAGCSGLDKITAMELAPDNDLYVAGILEGEGEFGETKFSGSKRRLFISRITKKGKCEWVQTLQCSASSSGFLLKSDKQGNIYFGGVFSDTLKSDKQEVYSNGFSDVFIARFTSTGQFEILKSFGGSGKDRLSAISTDDQGRLFLAGNFEKAMQVNDQNVGPVINGANTNVFLIRMDNSLKNHHVSVWYSPSYCEVTGLAVNKYQHLFITGNFRHTLICDTVNIKAKGVTDFFVCQVDTLMKINWIRSHGTRFETNANSLMVNKFNGVLVIGTFNDTLQLDTIPIFPKNTFNNVFSLQLTDQGKITWAESIGSNDGSSIGKGVTTDENGSLYLMGNFSGNIKTPQREFRSVGGEDIFIAKYFNCPNIKDVIEGSKYICQDSVVLLSVPRQFREIVWNDTLFDLHDLLVDHSGTYKVKMIDKNGCVIKDSIKIEKAPKMIFSIGRDTAISTIESLMLKGPDNASQYLWQDYSSGKDYSVYSADGVAGVLYCRLTVTDTLGCTWKDDMNIEFYKTPDYLDLSEGPNLVVLHPNPVKNILYWSLRTTKEARLNMEINDSNSKVFMRQEIKRYLPGEMRQVNMTSFPGGLYYFSIISGEHKITVKIIKE